MYNFRKLKIFIKTLKKLSKKVKKRQKMPKNGQKRAFFAKNPDEVSGEN